VLEDNWFAAVVHPTSAGGAGAGGGRAAAVDRRCANQALAGCWLLADAPWLANPSMSSMHPGLELEWKVVDFLLGWEGTAGILGQNLRSCIARVARRSWLRHGSNG
jgi:hypothetical protein